MADKRQEIRFLLNDRVEHVSDIGASATLLDHLRNRRRLTGTKEGCAEGDCGACSVLVGRMVNGALRYETVNACIRFLASLDGCHVVTIEHLKGADGGLHPVQQAMVAHHGAQCGFCTPGIIMSLYALWMQNPAPDDDAIETALQGNLCRCTGYAPIIRAAKSVPGGGTAARDALIAEREAVIAKLAELRDGTRVETSAGEDRAILPADLDDLAAVYEAEPKATIIAGATDVGLWVTKHMKSISPAIFINHLDELKTVRLENSHLLIGAGASYSECEAAIAEGFPWLLEYWRRIGGWQVRNMGTVGGNIANGSPIGDSPPVLIALGAEITLRKGETRRTMPIENYFIDYGKQDRAPGEFVETISIPRPAKCAYTAAYKISKRRDEDISAVAAGFNIEVKGGRIRSARIAFGGMAATPKRAAAAEAAMLGLHWGGAAFEAAAAVLGEDFTPLTDWRASSEYRMTAARNLFRRFWLEEGEGAKARLERAQGR